MLPDGRSGARCAGRRRPVQIVATQPAATDAYDDVLAVARVRIGRNGLARDPQIVYANGPGHGADLVFGVLSRIVRRAR